MLKKLIFHEFRATGRIFLPLYGAFIIMSFLMRGYMELQDAWQFELPGWLGIIGAIPVILYVLLFIATLAATVVVAIQRFYKNLMTEEGYLMFTLPVKVRQLINSKLLVAVVWTIVSALICVLSVFILAYSPQNFETIGHWWDIIVEMTAAQGFYMDARFLTELIIISLIEIVASYIMIYSAVAATNFSGNHKILMGIAAYLALNIVSQIVASLGMLLFGVMFHQSVTDMLFNSQNYMGFFDWYLWGSAAITVILAVLEYLLTNWILKRKLNLN